MSVHKSAVPWISHNVWRQVVDRSHRNIGVALARRWHLPAEIQGLYAGDYDADQVHALLVEGKRLLDMPDAALALLCSGLYGRVGSLFAIQAPVGLPPA
jgi:hypothetical protein